MHRDHAFAVEFPWFVQKLLRNEIIVLSDLPNDLPDEANERA